MNTPAKPRLVVVDDDPFMVKLMSMMVGTMDRFEVSGHTDASEAMRAIAADGADVVVLDINMPDVDGIECFRRLAALQYGGSLVLFSGESDALRATAEQIARSHGLRVAGSLQKPPQRSALERLLSAATAAAPGAAPHDGFDAAEMLDAIAAGGFGCEYLPRVTPAQGGCSAVSARLHWRHRTRGRLDLDAFGAAAERGGLLGQLTREVLETACARLREWARGGLELDVVVALNAQNLADPDFPDQAVDCARRHEVDPQRIVLELPDSAALDVAALEVLTRLRLRRLRVALADFGAADLPLTRLRDLGLREATLAPALLHDTGADARMMLDAALDLAHRLNLRLTATGVADRRAWNVCRERRLDLAEGAFIASPMPADAIPSWLRVWENRAWVDELVPRTR